MCALPAGCSCTSRVFLMPMSFFLSHKRGRHSGKTIMAEYKEYVCTLDEKSLKRAKEELNENPADRMNSVESFRKLIQTRAPHLICSLGKQLDKIMVLRVIHAVLFVLFATAIYLHAIL